MIVAIDGPAASGKGTLARNVAQALGLPHLDTGLLYRGVGHVMRVNNASPDDEAAAARVAAALDLSALDADLLRRPEAGEAASVVAAMPAVRAALIDRQRAFADQPGGAVLDGRDIGVVIAPHATIKFFVTATPEERARRRHRELVARGEAADDATGLAATLADIRKRDARDSGRTAAPMAIAPDAIVLDTTNLGVEEVVALALARIRERTP